MRIAGVAFTDDFANSAPVAHPHLLALGDVIPVPGPWPLGNVVSVGDILIMAGLLVIVHCACRAGGTGLSRRDGAAAARPAPPRPAHR
jgi:hypothetical protein